MRPYLKKILSLLTAGAMSLSALPFLSAAPDIPAAAAKSISTMTTQEIAADMGVGWNLGNTLDSHDGTNFKKLGLEAETYWGNPKATKALIQAVKAKGYKTIRVPVTWYPHADSKYNIDAKWMARVKEVVNYCIDEDMYVILNIHHEEGAWLNPSKGYNALSPQFKAFWQQIATEFKGYDRHLIFEGMNEPRTIGKSYEWTGGNATERTVINQLNKLFVDTVRATGGNNKTRCLMLPTYGASSGATAMQAFEMPANDDNLMVSIHAYTPYEFAMNGKGTSTFSSSMKTQLENLFSDINNCLLSKGYTVVIGEFGATNKYNNAERIKWANAFAELAKKKGIPIVMWDNNTVNNTDAGERFGLINRSTLKWYSESDSMVTNLIKTYKDTKTEVVTDPSVGLKDAETIYDKTLTASGYNKPSSAVTYDFPNMEEGSYIAVTYDTSSKYTIPTLIIQTKLDWSVWVKVTATAVKNGIAYYSYEDIAAAYAPAYKEAIKKDPNPALYGASQMLLSAEGGEVRATKIQYIPPVKPEPEKIKLSDCKATLSETEFVYNGQEHKPEVTVSYEGETLKLGTDYTVKYENNIEVGTARAVITAAGDKYEGTVTVSYVIVPNDLSGYKLGDVNLDGKIDITDVTMAISAVRGVAKLGDSRFKAADVDKDGAITITDVTKIISHVRGKNLLPDEYLA